MEQIIYRSFVRLNPNNHEKIIPKWSTNCYRSSSFWTSPKRPSWHSRRNGTRGSTVLMPSEESRLRKLELIGYTNSDGNDYQVGFTIPLKTSVENLYFFLIIRLNVPPSTLNSSIYKPEEPLPRSILFKVFTPSMTSIVIELTC